MRLKSPKKPAKVRIRREASDARNLIIKKAVECFANDGFYETSFQKIASACGLSQTAVLYHFNSKAALLHSVLRYILQNNQTIVSKFLEKEKTGMAKLKAHFEGNLFWALKHRHESKNILLLYYYGTYAREFSSFYKEIRLAAAGKIEAFLKLAKEEGSLRQGRDLKNLSFLGHDVLLGSLVNCASTGGDLAAQKQCREGWQLFFASVFRS